MFQILVHKAAVPFGGIEINVLVIEDIEIEAKVQDKSR
jgi:hypothetical protein